MLKNLGFVDLGAILKQNNEPEINSLAIISPSFLPEFLIRHPAFFIYLPSQWISISISLMCGGNRHRDSQKELLPVCLFAIQGHTSPLEKILKTTNQSQ